MNGLYALVVGMKTATLLFGGLVTLVTYRAYRDNRTRAFRSLFVGFALVTFGSLAAGAVHQLTSLSYDYAHVVESALTVVGFVVITHSLYTER